MLMLFLLIYHTEVNKKQFNFHSWFMENGISSKSVNPTFIISSNT